MNNVSCYLQIVCVFSGLSVSSGVAAASNPVGAAKLSYISELDFASLSTCVADWGKAPLMTV